MQPTGCLLIGNGTHGVFDGLGRKLESAAGIRTVRTDGMLADARKGLYAAGRENRRVCVAAQGDMWPVALALGVQLSVDRIVLAAPRDAADRQMERLGAFVRRNVFFCVSDVLVLEDMPAGKRLEKILGAMVNARVWRLEAGGQSADAAVLQAVRFLTGENPMEISGCSAKG